MGALLVRLCGPGPQGGVTGASLPTVGAGVPRAEVLVDFPGACLAVPVPRSSPARALRGAGPLEEMSKRLICSSSN